MSGGDAGTEARNPASTDLDRLSTLGFVELVNREDAGIAAAVAREAPRIAAAIDRIAASLGAGGRLIYVGAGTSGRLGVLDAAECPPTFGTEPAQVVALIAGGAAALTNAVEGAEDSAEQGAGDLLALAVAAPDVVVGITASGSTPYVLGALRQAAAAGAATIGICCNAGSPVAALADVGIERRDRSGGAVRVDANESGHRDQDGAQHAHDRRNGPARQDLRQPHGRPQGQ